MPCNSAEQYPREDPARYIEKEYTNKHFRNISPSISRRKIAIRIRIEIDSLFQENKTREVKAGVKQEIKAIKNPLRKGA